MTYVSERQMARGAALWAAPRALPTACLSAQESEDVLRERVRLGQHRHTGLLQDLVTRQHRCFSCEVRVLNPAARCRQVLRSRRQIRDRRFEAVLNRTER